MGKISVIRNKRHWQVQVLTFILLVLLIAENIFLILRNNELREEITRLSVRQVYPKLAIGDTVQSFSLKTLVGDSISLYDGDASTKYLLLVFAPDCPHCQNSVSFWNDIAQFNNENENWYVVGISLSSAEDARHFAMQSNAKFLVGTPDEAAFKKSHKIDAVPQTLIISGTGTVEKVWIGELSSKDISEIKSLLANGPQSHDFKASVMDNH